MSTSAVHSHEGYSVSKHGTWLFCRKMSTSTMFSDKYRQEQCLAMLWYPQAQCVVKSSKEFAVVSTSAVLSYDFIP